MSAVPEFEAADFKVIEADVRRVWTALRFVDGMTGRAIQRPLQVAVKGLRTVMNRAGLVVVMQVDEPAVSRKKFEDVEAAFDPIPVSPALTIAGSVSDPERAFLPRSFSFDLPRAAGADQFTPVSITLDPSPATPVLATWAVLRISVRNAGKPAAQASLRVRRTSGGAVIGRGLTDARGEALVAVVGVAQVTPGVGVLVVETEIDATVDAHFDPDAPAGVPVNTDVLAADNTVLRKLVNQKIASGRTDMLVIDLP
jgi:hypothetical protein